MGSRSRAIFLLTVTVAAARAESRTLLAVIQSQQEAPKIKLGLGPKAVSSQEKVADTKGSPRKFEVGGNPRWLDTGIDLAPGDRVRITAGGELQFQMQGGSGPDGQPRAWMDLLRSLPVNSAGRGALVARIGSGSAAPFAVGSNWELEVRQSGRLFLGVNQLEADSVSGKFDVTVEVTPAPEAARKASLSASDSTLSPAELSTMFTTEFFGKLPRRVTDAQGNSGDMVNFLMLGTEEQVLSAFESAGWVKVDASTGDAVLHGVLASISKRAYLEMPMSSLNLFGRPQDYGFAHAEPVSVVATRHHLRIWKSPFEIGGQTLWVGAGTHDIGFERDQRNNGVTHRIDPAVDGEREFIGESLRSTGLLSKVGYVTPPDPITEARTATGGSFHSDGRILVMTMGK